MATSSDSQPLKEGEVDIGDYRVQVLDPIGTGAFGRVCSAYRRDNDKKIAAKGIDFMNDYTKTIALEEGKLAKSLSHRNLVKLFDINERKKTVWLFYEFCEFGNLPQYMERYVRVSLDCKFEFMLDITNAVAYLHTYQPRIIHRDIKPENVVIAKGNPRHTAKLTDFGDCKMYESSVSNRDSLFYLRQNSTYKGTPNYMAPEFFLEGETGLNYTPTVDIFSLGLLFNFILESNPHHRSTMPLSGTKHSNNHCIN